MNSAKHIFSNIAKFILLYTRVSTDSQDKKMQVSAAQRFLEQFNKDRILELHDDGVSATKSKIEERPELNKLLTLVKENKIETLVVYHRDRLARNTYQYLEIAKILIDYNVKVIFTASNQPPFTYDLDTESIFALMSQVEGAQITTRTADARMQFPSRLFGYNPEGEKGKKMYRIDEPKKEIVVELFNKALAAQSPNDLYTTIKSFKKKYKKKEETVLRILFNPFYCGHYYSQEQYQPLSHVEPMINLDTFLRVQERITDYKNILVEAEARHTRNKLLDVKCSVCQSSLNYKEDIDNLGLGIFSCRNHKDIFIESDELNLLVEEIVQECIRKFDDSIITKCFMKSINKQAKAIKMEEKSITTQMLAKKYSYTLNPSGNDGSKTLKELKKLETDYLRLMTQEEKIKNQKMQIKQLKESAIGGFINSLEKGDLLELIPMLIRSVEISTQEIHFDLYYWQLLEGINNVQYS